MAGNPKRTLAELARVTKLMDDTKVQRDRLITKARREGSGATEVAKIAGLSRGRIYQIEEEAK